MKRTENNSLDQCLYPLTVWLTSILFIIFILQSVKTVDAGQTIDTVQGHLSVHQPLSTGDCSICHSGSSFEISNSDDSICIRCHQKYDIMSMASKRKSGHSEFECLDCHEPHFSDYQALLVSPISDLCANCHNIDPISPNKYSHFQDRCDLCHDPHAVNTQYYLSGSSLNLCQDECHSSENLGRSHPMGDGVNDKYANTIMTCTSSCHRVHNSNYPTYLSAHPDKICYRCHSEIFIGGNGTLAQTYD